MPGGRTQFRAAAVQLLVVKVRPMRRGGQLLQEVCFAHWLHECKTRARMHMHI